MNPCDKAQRVSTIKKVTSGSTPQIADLVDELYGQIIVAGTHKAPPIRVAEAAKVNEHTQRDVHIPLVNELRIFFTNLGLDPHAVLEKAGPTWTFRPFRPRLAGAPRRRGDPSY